MSAAEAAATEPLYDLLGIGVGPFNLGLAALTDPLPELNTLFLDSSSGFDWHPGMMLESAHLQVPFMADLVTLADPCSRYSFLNFLKQTNRLYRFYIRENFYPLRAEFNAYCRWVADQLPGVRFGHRVTGIVHLSDGGESVYEVTAQSAAGIRRYRTRRLVLGTGTRPYLPPAAQSLRQTGATVLHNSDYLARKQELQQKRSITIVGSGQSAAELYLDLLEEMDGHGYELNWVTRSGRFFPLEYTKLTLEMTSPDYVDYFHALPGASRDRLIAQQKNLYKGIDSDLINTIYDTLYAKSLRAEPRTRLLTHLELRGATVNPATGASTLELHHTEQDRPFSLQSDAVVLATGYTYREPEFLTGIAQRIRRDAAGRFDVDRWYGIGTEPAEIFVQNAELHTHGFVTPDLGMAAYRNSAIIRAVLGREVYPVETSITFQEFGAPQNTAVPVQDEPAEQSEARA
ncbi:SidA/IucD/PvdA family monooxygenase [Arthrobacter zhangbolii]|uniref:L-lysine N6-monooxygenase MbtG n=1 Tax=Arthrobacter zhangbolii TaxID=2886936 RepID=A0A9X1MA86_9MICC|nr:SidA/IucD/PvdA family monooxygenase [Arthrobacter zhangbolii]MCC3273615.1 SidA/IucD/PvdA family monooxygenase [Arthrobacter zhangbolii]UON92423.1 SidA/IucD/PvdA family monooxygenase [Arthrobacter zhangbolii]